MGGKHWRTQKLMEICGWFTARELVEFHTLVLVWKIINFSKPKVLSEKIELRENREISARYTRLKITYTYFIARSVQFWNRMTDDLRNIRTISSFKTKLKKHILEKRTLNTN